ncbi:MAG: hypothetical protein IJV39_00485 [Ruminococcus sp.]|nr:hypothetical protein [Ruminococcus sp.]
MRVEHRTVTVTKFVAEDGTVFDKRAECVYHELRKRVEPLVKEHLHRSFGNIWNIPDEFIESIVVDTISKMEEGVIYNNSEILEKIKISFAETFSKILNNKIQ